MPDLTTTLLVLRSHLRSAAGAFTGRSVGCADRVPLWQRWPLWLAAAAVPAWAAPHISDAPMFHLLDSGSGPESSYWYAIIAALAAVLIHGRCCAWVFAGRHLHCDLCDECSLNVGGRTFPDDRNAVAFAISELDWFAETRPGRIDLRIIASICDRHPGEYPDENDTEPA